MTSPARSRAQGRLIRAMLVIIVAGVVTGSPLPGQAQGSGTAVAPVPILTANTTVGQQNVNGQLNIVNVSSGNPADNVPVTVTNIVLDPSCNVSTFPCPAGQKEPNVFCIDGQTTNPCPTPSPTLPTPVGRAGTACMGTTFTVSGDARTGAVTFVPSAPVVLGPANGSAGPSTCIIDFTYDVVGRPADGATFAVAGVMFTSSVSPNPSPGTGTSQQLIVNQATVTLTTNATPTGNQPPPVTTSDTATLTENVPEANPTGTVTFQLVGPSPTAGCAGPVVAGSQQTRPVTGGTTASTNVSPAVSAPGVYNWIATYSGDVNFAGIGPVGCGDPAERFTVVPPTPVLDVQKDATPSSRPAPGGTFTFTVRMVNAGPTNITVNSINDNIYGNLGTANPNVSNNTCPALIGTTLTANGGTATCTFDAQFTGAPRAQTDTVTVAGTDVNGTPVQATDDATITITPVTPSITLQKDANPLTRPEPGGTYTFTVKVTNTSPAGDPVTINTLSDSVYGNIGSSANPNITNNNCPALIGAVLQPGGSATCTFDASFTGDPRIQTDTVTATGTDTFGNPVNATDDATIQITPVAPSINVLKTANPTSRPEPGGNYTFTVQVTNTSGPSDPVTIDTIHDNVYGDLGSAANANVTNNTCPTLIGTTLAPGATTSCTFTASFTGAARAQTDTVTVTGHDNDNTPVQDTDDATIEITPLVPTITIVKTPNPTSLPEPGGAFTFTLTITNTSGPLHPVTINTLNDNVYGNLGSAANANVTNNTCPTLIGTTLQPGASATCSFTGQFTGSPGAAQTDTVTVTGQDSQGTPVMATAQATVTITPAAPSIAVVKTADPTSRPAPGGAFTFTVQITNTSGPTDPVTIDTIKDNIYGDLGAAANPNVTNNTCPTLINTTLAPGASATCTFTGQFTGAAGANQTDIVTVTGHDDEGTPVNGHDDATVFLTGAPAIAVQKDASPLTRPEPGGDFTFTVVVRNPSGVPVAITGLTDNIYGDLATRPGSTCGALIGTTLAPGASSAPCSFTGSFTGNPGSQTDIVTVTGTGPGGTPVQATDDATVTITDVPPQIAVTKSANPLTRPAPGGTFTFTVQVRNPSTVEPLKITALTDNIYGNLATRPGSTCGTLIGTTLAPGATSPTCTFTGDFTGTGGQTQTDVVTATGQDNEGNTVTATATATVGITSQTPQIVVTKSASPQSRPEPGGTFTFTAQVFNNGPVPVRITAITDNIYGNLATRAGSTCGSLINTTLASGATATCTFTGDFTGQPGASQTDIVTVTAVDNNGATVTDHDDATVFITGVPSSMTVQKDSTPASRPEPGGVFTFPVRITNTSAVDSITIQTINDDIYGNVGSASNANVRNNTCPSLIGTVLAPSQSATCQFDGVFTGHGGQSQTDTVTVTAIDDDNQPLTATDNAIVSITSVPPVIAVQKDASPTTRPEPGGSFTFTVKVTNMGVNPVTITTIRDNIYGDLNGKGTCQIGARLQPFPGPGNVYTCSFSADFRGNAGASQTDVVTVTAVDDNRVPTTNSDDATVTLTNVPPTITSTKTANPVSLPEPGGTFTFTFSVKNTSQEPVRITSLVDNVYGDLNGRGTCAIGSTLQPNETYTCQFTASFTGVGGQKQTDTITVTAVDDENTPVTSTSQATVELTNVPPTIGVTKTASPTSRVVPGGDFTFTMSVTNTSNKPVTVTSIVDNVFGNLNGRGTCAVGAVLQPGQSYTCSFTAAITSNVPGSQTDIITVGAVDNQGNPAVNQATATVRLEAAPPAVLGQQQPPPQQQPLPRTGMDVRQPAALAGMMVMFGFILVGATWRSSRLRLAFTPAPDDFVPPPPPPSARAGFGLGLGFGGGPTDADGPRRPHTGGAALTLRTLGAALFWNGERKPSP